MMQLQLQVRVAAALTWRSAAARPRHGGLGPTCDLDGRQQHAESAPAGVDNFLDPPRHRRSSVIASALAVAAAGVQAAKAGTPGAPAAGCPARTVRGIHSLMVKANSECIDSDVEKRNQQWQRLQQRAEHLEGGATVTILMTIHDNTGMA
jgi:hypothetical protein